MKLNCRRGDLAVVVRPGSGGSNANVGKVVRCLRLNRSEPLLNRDGRIVRAAVWDTDVPLRAWDDTYVKYAEDARLCPIRPDGISESEVSALYQPSPEFAESNFHLADGVTVDVHGSEGRTA